MKIAVSAKGTGLESEVDPRFGRAAYILIIDPETLDFDVVDNNTNVNAFKGAGIQTATTVSDKGAEVLLTGYCGPKAFEVLKAAGIRVANDISGTVQQAVERFNAGQLTYAGSANADSHW